jgi:hypothetical protein
VEHGVLFKVGLVDGGVGFWRSSALPPCTWMLRSMHPVAGLRARPAGRVRVYPMGAGWGD